jgi:PAS domain S-box-containing protein
MTATDKTPILLVDDRPENLIALENLLEDPGLDIFTAPSGNEALRLTLKHDFALVLMDVRMPDMDGFETAELMRAYPKTSCLPIIFVSAVMKDTKHQFKGFETGAFDYLLKPIDPTILRSKVRVFCDLYQQRQMLETHEQQLEAIIRERTAELNTTLDNLRESEKRFRALLESVTSYMFTVAMDDGRAVSTEHGAGCLGVTGFSAGEYAADPDLWYRMIHPDDQQKVLDAAQQLLTSKAAVTFEHRIQHKDGSIRWVQATLVPRVDRAGELRSYDGVISDITERKRAEEKILLLNQELEQRVRERTKELERRNFELEQMNKVFVGRELRMAELKGKIAELEKVENQERHDPRI